MGFSRWYDKRIREKLEFPDIPKETVQRHFDVYEEFGYTGFMWRTDKELDELFKGKPCIEWADYIIYLGERVDSKLNNLITRVLVTTADAIFG